VPATATIEGTEPYKGLLYSSTNEKSTEEAKTASTAALATAST
jgi:hypothetical protein